MVQYLGSEWHDILGKSVLRLFHTSCQIQSDQAKRIFCHNRPILSYPATFLQLESYLHFCTQYSATGWAVWSIIRSTITISIIWTRVSMLTHYRPSTIVHSIFAKPWFVSNIISCRIYAWRVDEIKTNLVQLTQLGACFGWIR